MLLKSFIDNCNKISLASTKDTRKGNLKYLKMPILYRAQAARKLLVVGCRNLRTHVCSRGHSKIVPILHQNVVIWALKNGDTCTIRFGLLCQRGLYSSANRLHVPFSLLSLCYEILGDLPTLCAVSTAKDSLPTCILCSHDSYRKFKELPIQPYRL